MGSVAAIYADHIILTSDNPRDEDPATIVEDIRQGIDEKDMHKVAIELDRKKAILTAYKKTREGSIIALLGKGNDEYQIIGNKKTYFSEREILEGLE
jgi:UDP-N-acetylmuramoyl-L-alanyl-D-glutamate--2,6-diaminopimelate ligase